MHACHIHVDGPPLDNRRSAQFQVKPRVKPFKHLEPGLHTFQDGIIPPHPEVLHARNNQSSALLRLPEPLSILLGREVHPLQLPIGFRSRGD